MSDPVPQRNRRVEWSWGDGAGTHRRLLAATLADCREPEGCDDARIGEYVDAGHTEKKVLEAVKGAWEVLGGAKADPKKSRHDVDWNVEVVNPIAYGTECSGLVLIRGEAGGHAVATAHEINLRDPKDAKSVVDDACDSFRVTQDESGRAQSIDIKNRMALHRILQEKRIMSSSNEGAPERLELVHDPKEIQGESTWECCGIEAPVGGVTIVYGRGGSLKSRAVFESLLRIALYYDRKVVMLDTEPFHSDLKKRLFSEQIIRHVEDAENDVRLGVDLKNRENYEPLSGADVKARIDKNLVVYAMTSWTTDALRTVQPVIAGADVVCVDSITACISDDISSSAEAIKWFRSIKGLKARTVVAIAHQVKSQRNIPAASSSPLGSQTWESNARLTIAATRRVKPPDPGECERTAAADFIAVKSNCRTPEGETSLVSGRWNTLTDRADVDWESKGVVSAADREQLKIIDYVEKMLASVKTAKGEGIMKTALGNMVGIKGSGNRSAVIEAMMADDRFAAKRWSSGVRFWAKEYAPAGACTPPCTIPPAKHGAKPPLAPAPPSDGKE